MARTVKYQFNPFDLVGDVPKDKRASVMREMRDVLEAEIRGHLADSTSPVSGHGKFPALSKDYKAYKQSQGRPGVPNLELWGDMLSALQVTANTSSNTITVQIRGKQGEKADGHCNHSGDSNLPLRRFIPMEDEEWNRNVQRALREVAQASREED